MRKTRGAHKENGVCGADVSAKLSAILVWKKSYQPDGNSPSSAPHLANVSAFRVVHFRFLRRDVRNAIGLSTARHGLHGARTRDADQCGGGDPSQRSFNSEVAKPPSGKAIRLVTLVYGPAGMHRVTSPMLDTFFSLSYVQPYTTQMLASETSRRSRTGGAPPPHLSCLARLTSHHPLTP